MTSIAAREAKENSVFLYGLRLPSSSATSSSGCAAFQSFGGYTVRSQMKYASGVTRRSFSAILSSSAPRNLFVSGCQRSEEDQIDITFSGMSLWRPVGECEDVTPHSAYVGLPSMTNSGEPFTI